ncbi:hypothetical protein, partial [uncultured Methylobacterium sp.]|uniref:hypothetical protein n=1 Tax=uncultured Methylobacterium sp. TaxID=157278 RepID=UPI0035C9B17E
VVQAGLDEVARFLAREDPPTRPNARPARLGLAAIAWHLRGGRCVASAACGLPALAHGLRLVPALLVARGLFERLVRALARRQRRRCGRRPALRLAIIDTHPSTSSG